MLRALAGILLCVAGSLDGQPTPAPQFEVASIKPYLPAPSNGSSGSKSGQGRLTMIDVTLKRCIMGAYGVGPNQILGGPDWLNSNRYEIVAKADQPVGDGILMAMLQSLLAERFKLAIHRETRTLPAFVLEVGKNEPKLERAENGESTTRNRRGQIEAKIITMDRFAEVLSRQMDLPVVNRTGLEGAFNLTLEWTPESAKPANADGLPMESAPSIFTAIQQLGLSLRSRKTPVAVLVIDHAEKPSEN